MAFWGTQTVTGREPPGPVWAPETAFEALSCPLFLVPWLRCADLPAEGCHRQKGDCSTHGLHVYLHQKARSLYLKFGFQWDSWICLAALTAPSPPLVGSWVFPSFPLQTAKVVGMLSCCSCARTPTGRAPQSGLRSLMGFVTLLDSAGFLSSGCRPSTLPPATCQRAGSPTALPTERITKLWDPCHFVW